MKNTKIKLIKSKRSHPVKVYFDDDRIPNRIEKLAAGMGLSVSSATGMIIRYGLPELEKAVHKITVQDNAIKKSK